METVKTVTTLVSTRDAAARLGVSESSIKRWCDQGKLELVKTAGGHRRLRLDSVQRLARETGRVASYAEGEAELTGRRQARAALKQALLTGDEPSAQAAIERAFFAAHGYAELADEIVAPVLADLGARWARGSLEVYAERRACELLTRGLLRLSSSHLVERRTGLSAVGGSLPGDPFTLPTLLAELVLREAGWVAQSLGSSLPAETLERAVEELRPDVLWLSVACVPDEHALLQACGQLHAAACARGASLVLGGRGITPALRKRLRFATHCDSMSDLRAFAFALGRAASAKKERGSSFVR